MVEGLMVTRMGYGAMQLAGPHVFGPPADCDAAVAVLREVVAQGITHIDTSDFYGPPVTNQIIREALYPYPDSLHSVTFSLKKLSVSNGEPCKNFCTSQDAVQVHAYLVSRRDVPRVAHTLCQSPATDARPFYAEFLAQLSDASGQHLL